MKEVKRGRRKLNEVVIISKENEELSEIFLTTINELYDELKNRMVKYCYNKSKLYSDDVFNDTILLCYNSILKNGLNDPSNEGCQNYFFKSFKMNTLRNTQYSYNSKRDDNVDNLNDINENYLQNQPKLVEKLTKDLFTDFATIYILNEVENNFDIISFYCFRIKYLIPNTTYNDLLNLTKIKDCKKRVLDVKKWLQLNVKITDIEKAFKEYYSEILE